MPEFPSLSLILGGASSGKSVFAETLALGANRPPLYIATAQAFDDEMTGKIKAHRARRGAEWGLVEAPLDLAGAIEKVKPNQVVLVDCLTLWLSNILFAERDVNTEFSQLTRAVMACPSPVIAVSNELGLGLVPDTSLGRRFRDAQGQLNQMFAAQAAVVTFIAAGLPLPLKGILPEVAP